LRGGGGRGPHRPVPDRAARRQRRAPSWGGGPGMTEPGAGVCGGGFFGGGTDELIEGVGEATYAAAVFRVLVDRGEITYFVAREHLLALVQALRDDEALRFELCSSVSGVDYLDSGGPAASPDRPRLHVVYHLTSMTYRRRIRLEGGGTPEDPPAPSVTRPYPTADWHERETFDMFGIVFDGHPALTRILMPDDWDGH